MSYSILFAKFFGFYILIMMGAMLARKDHFVGSVKSFLKSDALVVVTAMFTIILGVFLVLLHNIWIAEWPALVTLLCWLTLLKGVILLFFPKRLAKKSQKMTDNPAPFYAGAVINSLVAVFLLYSAFTV